MEILIAEDDAIMRHLLKDTLEDWNYTVHEAENGREALEKTNSIKDLQLLLIDWSMPEIDGIDVCQKLKTEFDKFTYIIMLTAKSSLGHSVTALDAGADDYIVKPFLPEDLQARLRVGRRIIESERKLEQLAHYDSLTGIRNRRMVLKCLNNEWERSQREGSSLSVIMLDIDHFKNINDTYGHEGGDHLLKDYTRIVEQQLRPYDILGRMGGEEFLIVLPRINEAETQRIAERVRKAVETALLSIGDSRTVKITTSVGATMKSSQDADANMLLRRADEALYSAKHQGRNRVVFC